MLDFSKDGTLKSTSRSAFELITQNEHEQVVYCYDKPTGLKAIIAIHSTVLGPSLGGARMWDYESDQEALVDVLRLSQGMTYKAAISGLNLGGGKAVIIGDARKDKSEALWKRYGQFIESLSGRYITAEDVGTSTDDMEIVKQETDYVTGLPKEMGGSGDPSPFTAYGVFLGMKACAKYRWDSESLEGKKIAVQGVGHVGQHLVKHLSEGGAKIYITDIYEDKLEKVSQEYDVEVVDKDEIYDLDMDIYAPCALGATVNDETLERLQCKIIAGAANNQLADENKHGREVMEKGILYAPDFLINAGGLINVYTELHGYDQQKATELTQNIYESTSKILNKANQENLTTVEAAKRIAVSRIEENRKVKA
jgi:leucine dehydrogenase